MATFKICIYEHQKRKDGKFPVSIRVCWRRKYAYIKTEFYVNGDQINKRRFEVKDPFIVRELNFRIASFETIKSTKLGFRIESMTAKELADYLEEEFRSGEGEVNLTEYGFMLSDKLKKAGRISCSRTYARTMRSVVDYCNGRNVFASEITPTFLQRYCEYLKTERQITRKNRHGQDYKYLKGPLTDVAIGDYLAVIRAIFNAAILEFNDEDAGRIRIKNDPFRRFKVKRPSAPKRTISDVQMSKIMKATPDQIGNDHAIFARDVFVISFLLCGTNAADLYECPPPKDGRIEYKRKKTRTRRSDEAFISMRIEPELEPYLEKYKDPTGKRAFRFHLLYLYDTNFSNAVNRGLKILAAALKIDIPLTMYYGRHAWATIARNKAGVSKDDIDLSLNHIDQERKMADVYIETDWSLIDKANRAVLDHVGSIPDPVMIQEIDTPKSDDK